MNVKQFVLAVPPGTAFVIGYVDADTGTLVQAFHHSEIEMKALFVQMAKALAVVPENQLAEAPQEPSPP